MSTAELRFDPARHRLEPLEMPGRIAIISFDVEPDYNGASTTALDRYRDALDVLSNAEIPLTAFVEGRLLEQRHEVVTALAASGADIQLHCYDHRMVGGDTVETLAQGVRAYAYALGRRPLGYRANTFRLSEALLTGLIDMGFRWDSSVLPGIGLGGMREWPIADNAVARIDGRLIEFPLATWGGVRLPISQSYRNLIGPWAEAMLRRLTSPPSLLVYNMHMVDLVRSGAALKASPLPASVKTLMSLCWRWRRENSFTSLLNFVSFLRQRNYEFTTLGALYSRFIADPHA